MADGELFWIIKIWLLYLQEFCSFEEFQTELELYLEFYNHNRIKAKLGGLSPVQYGIQDGLAAWETVQLLGGGTLSYINLKVYTNFGILPTNPILMYFRSSF